LIWSGFYLSAKPHYSLIPGYMSTGDDCISATEHIAGQSQAVLRYVLSKRKESVAADMVADYVV
jgi:hypothetical protein